jgi:hypothetical protein
MAGTSITWPLFVAIAGALTADPFVAAKLAGERVYNTVAPNAAPLDYVVLGGSISESEFWLFTQGASTASLMLHAFCGGDGNRRALELYGELHRVLHRQTIPIEGFGAMTSELRLIDVQPDPDGRTMHLIARYEITAVRV